MRSRAEPIRKTSFDAPAPSPLRLIVRPRLDALPETTPPASEMPGPVESPGRQGSETPGSRDTRKCEEMRRAADIADLLIDRARRLSAHGVEIRHIHE